jgi:hypothetical protein
MPPNVFSLYSITEAILDQDHKLCFCALCNCLHPPATASLRFRYLYSAQKSVLKERESMFVLQNKARSVIFIERGKVVHYIM